jgi:retron-type reverse transcriptase
MKYFPSIDHRILKELLERVVKCSATLALAGKIIDGSNLQTEVVAYFPGDDLFTPHERRRGLPLGNQTSQFFANVYLNPLDHFIKRTLRPAVYARYVDDFLLFSDDKAALADMRVGIDEFLAGLRVRTHPGKTRVNRAAEGVTFLGWRLFPDRLRLERGNVVRFQRRLRDLRAAFMAGQTDWADVTARVQAWIAHAGHGDT